MLHKKVEVQDFFRLLMADGKPLCPCGLRKLSQLSEDMLQKWRGKKIVLVAFRRYFLNTSPAHLAVGAARERLSTHLNFITYSTIAPCPRTSAKRRSTATPL